MIVLVSLAFALPPGGGQRTSVNVQIEDTGRALRGSPVLAVHGDAGDAECSLRDDGRPPTDMHADDHIWCCDVAFPGKGPWQLAIRAEGASPRGALAAGDVRQGVPVFLSLGHDVLSVRTDISVPAPDAAGPTTEGDAPPMVSSTPRVGRSAWAALLMLVGAVLAPLWILSRPARGARRPLEAGGIAPVSVPLAGLDGRVAELALTHRVLLLGVERPGAIAVTSAATPEELVADAERIAASPGLPVALVIADPGLLERHRRERWRDLAERVGGRFPLWAVGGPWG